MYRDHFGLTQAPFSEMPQSDTFYPDAGHGAALVALQSAIEKGLSFTRVNGLPGTGKTMLWQMVTDRLAPEYIALLLEQNGLDAAGLGTAIATKLQARSGDDRAVLRRIERRLRALQAKKRRVVLCIDNAHLLTRDALDLLRIISTLETDGQRLLQFVLLTCPEFDKTLGARELRVLRGCITQNLTLAPLGLEQISHYLDFRFRVAGYHGSALFPQPLLTLVSRASKGRIGMINAIVDRALLLAARDELPAPVEAHVKSAIQQVRNPHRNLPVRPLLGGLAGILVIAAGGLSIHYLMRPAPTSVEAATHPAQASVAMQRSALARPPEVQLHIVPKSPPTTSIHTTPLQPQAASLAATVQAPTAPATEAPERFAPIPPQLGPSARALLQTSRTSMDAIADNQWFLQIRSIPAVNAANLETFLSSANKEKGIDPAKLRLFVVKGDPKQTVGVIYGEYPSQQAANADLPKLPLWIRRSGAYARSYKALRGDKTGTVVSGAGRKK
jgi:MSHA biogenesis protein MshM